MKPLPEKKDGFYLGKDMDDYVSEVCREAEESSKESSMLKLQIFISKLIKSLKQK